MTLAVAPTVASLQSLSLAVPPVVYGLALLTALLWGLEPVLGKRGMDGGGSALQASLVVVVVDSSLYWVALGALALFTTRSPFAGLTPLALCVFLGSGLVGTALGRLAVFAGVERVGASINSAAISSRPLFATALAVALLDEAVSLLTVAGIVVLVVGLVVLSLSRGGDVRGWARRDLAFPLLAAGLFAVGNVARRFGLQLTPATALEAVALNETAALVGLAAFTAARGRRDVLSAPRRTYALFVGSGLLTAVALLSMFAAFRHPAGRVAVVDPLVSAAPLFTVVFAVVLLRDVERVTVGVLGGAALVVVGAVLVTVG